MEYKNYSDFFIKNTKFLKMRNKFPLSTRSYSKAFRYRSLFISVDIAVLDEIYG